jgi:hypothetical protein
MPWIQLLPIINKAFFGTFPADSAPLSDPKPSAHAAPAANQPGSQAHFILATKRPCNGENTKPPLRQAEVT